MSNDQSNAGASRRDFIKTASVAAGAAVVTQLTLPAVHAAGSDQIKVGVIGCGGRGTQAAENVLSAAPNVKVVAIGDVFEGQVKNCRERLVKIAGSDKIKQLGNSVELSDGACHQGLDAYKGVLASEANYVILATPPGFRPIHLEAAVAAGKTIFTEKPVGVDGPGIRKVLKAYEESLSKNLAIVAGTQRRHQRAYVETLKQIHDGAIGDVVGGRGYWNQNTLWKRDRKPGMSDAVYQIYNWYAYVWLCGDHIVEQHVHNLDVLNWAFRSHPEKAVGMGYRVPRDRGYGAIFNCFAIDYEYPKGVHALSMCRQISGCANEVAEYVVGSKGTCRTDDGSKIFEINGKRIYTAQEARKHTNPYVQEHTDLIESLRSGKPLNELKQVAESTLTAIMGRMSAYTGNAITWDMALNSKESTYPEGLTLDMSLPEPEIPTPGKTKFV
ncbi:MAG TPA: Gfo/Idh/MocA family oxidoreductase [Gemmataceae bacterium]|jgi:predicted dehydrogenase